MRIGILTQPLHSNYGGILQNWALQQVLKKMGHEPETLDIQMGAGNLLFKDVVRNVGSFLKELGRRYLLARSGVILENPFSHKYIERYVAHPHEDFINRNINRVSNIYDLKKINRIIDSRGYEAFIVGSDQVWRNAYSPRIETYFLDFLREEDNRKKIAFSASFGCETCDIPQDKIEVCQELLKRFDAVSVRESSGLDILTNQFGYENALQTLDPTLLLDKEDYLGLIKDEDRSSGHYVGAYIIDETNEKNIILTETCKYFNLKYKRASCNYHQGKMHTISQWLALFADADFIVTDSFHGCVFSIIFQKPFIAIANLERGLDRFISLLKPLGLQDRLIIRVEKNFNIQENLEDQFDYRSIYKKIDTNKCESIYTLYRTIS